MGGEEEDSIDLQGLLGLIDNDAETQVDAVTTLQKDEAYKKDASADGYQHSSPAHRTEYPSRPTSPRTNHYSHITGTTDTGIDRTGSLKLDYSMPAHYVKNPTQYEEETQRDPDSYHEKIQSMIGLISEREPSSVVQDWDVKDFSNEETQQPTQFSPEVSRFDESRRWEDDGNERSAKRRRIGSHEDEDITPLADLEATKPDFTLSQLFDASSPPPRPNVEIPTSPTFELSPHPMLPDNLILDTPLAPRLQPEPFSEYRTINESQKRRQASRILCSGSDDDSDENDSMALRARKKQRERNRDKENAQMFMNIVAPRRPGDAKRRGRPRKVEVPLTSSLANITSDPREQKNEDKRKRTMGRSSKSPIVVDQSAVSSVEIVQETTILERGAYDQEAENEEDSLDAIVQVPSTAKRDRKRTTHTSPSPTDVVEKTPTLVTRRSREDTVELKTSSPVHSVDGDLPPTQDTAIADSQPNLAMPMNRHDMSTQLDGESMVVESSAKDLPIILRQEQTIDLNEQSTSVMRAVEAYIGPTSSDPPPAHTPFRKLRQRKVVSSSPFAGPVQDEFIPSSPPVIRNVQIIGHITESSALVQVSSGYEEQSIIPASGNSVYETAQQSNQVSNQKNHVFETPYPAKSIRTVNPTTIPETSPRERFDDSFSPLAALANDSDRKTRAKTRAEASPSIPDSVLKRGPTSHSVHSTLALNDNDSDPPNYAIKHQLPMNLTGKTILPAKRDRPSALRRMSGFKEVQDSLEAVSAIKDANHSEPAHKSSSPSEKRAQSRTSSPMTSPPPTTSSNSDTPPRLTAESLANLANITPTPNPNKGSFTYSKSDSSLKETHPSRVFAQFKGANYMYYAATLKSTISTAPGEPIIEAIIAFDDGQESTLPSMKVRRLHLEPGDTVKVNRVGLKSKTWSVTDLKTREVPLGASDTVAVKYSFTDIYGHNKVVLQQRSSRKNPSEDMGESEIIEVFVSDVYLTSAQWPQMVKRNPFYEKRSVRSPTRPGSAQSTPSTKMVRRVASALPGGKAEGVDGSVGLGLSTGVNGHFALEPLFSRMIFAVSYGDKEGDKKTITTKIQTHGGTILEGGFQSLFVQTASAYDAQLVVRDESSSTGFACVIADRHSRTSKYLQALALGLPCLAGKWVDDCVKKGSILPWEDYLLPSGESSHLNGAIKSRVLQSSLADQTHFSTVFTDRRQLFDNQRLIFVMGRNKADERRKPHLFLVHAMGAASVARVHSMDEANVLLTDATIGNTYDYVITKTNAGGKAPAKKNKVVVVEDEWVIQSLILGRLIDDDY